MNDYQLKQEFKKVTAEVEALEIKIADMEEQLADPELFADPVKGKAIMTRYEADKATLGKSASWWEELAEAMTERELDL